MANEDTLSDVRAATRDTARPLQSLLRGEKRTAGTLFQGVANTDTKQLLIENNTADKYLLLFEPTVRSSGQYFARKRKNVTVDTTGADAPLINPKTDDATPLAVSASTAGDGETGAISGGTNYPQLTAGSGSNPNNASPGQSGTTGISDAIAPGDTLAVEAQNQSGGTQDISLIVEFLAVPESVADPERLR